MPTYGGKIYRTCREAAGLTQEQDAERLNCSVRTKAKTALDGYGAEAITSALEHGHAQRPGRYAPGCAGEKTYV